MKIHRFITAQPISAGRFVLEDRAMVHQIVDVLRLHVDERVVFADGKGNEAEGTVVACDKHAVEVDLDEVHQNTNEPTRGVTLYVAVVKREHMEWIVQKATEVGVREIVPLVTTRTVKTGLRLDRLQVIAREAAELCGRATVPVIHEPQLFAEALISAKKNAMNMAFERGGTKMGSSLLPATVGVFVGPEGGWTEQELASMREQDFQFQSLGSLTLRAETAATIAAYLACWG
ncbi:MAG: RsmE family RNA methyltransferase [Patescibacteria group bacterium]